MSGPAEESAVKVCVRVRPLIEREQREATDDSGPVPLYWKADTKSLHQLDDGVPIKSFSYDRVFSSSETTDQLYQGIAKPLVVSAVEGYNGTIFAYGQTSSGKTFTMMGSDLVPGVIPLSMEEVFQTIQKYPEKEFLLRVSYLEIYNETVTDLLVDSWKRKPLEVREALNKNIYVADLTEELVTSSAQALSWIRKGEKNRHYGKTKMNERSSRSHTIFRMILESREKSDPASGENSDGAIIVSHLNLVDLAGSERASQTGAEGARFKEGCNINRSLFTLAQVIKKLSDESQRGFTNYRDSKLTRILQNSLGGNAKTVIICTITPSALDVTLSTLQFASTAKKMKNDPHVTEVSDDGALLKRYRNEIVDLKRRLQEVSSVTHVTATEKETLSQLLQEKEQLQKEQQDRIRNLTKLLVTGSSVMPTKKIPKRRVTWGGKLLRLAGTTECNVDQSYVSFAEHSSRKRKADLSSIELLEEDNEFDSERWEIPEDFSYEMDSTSSRASGDSSQLASTTGSGQKEAELERQLEEERGEKGEALAKLSSLEGRLEGERGEKGEALAKLSSLEGRLEGERGEKEEALAKLSSLEGRLEGERGEKEEVLAKLSSLEGRLEEERGEKEEVLAKLSSLEDEREEVLAKLSSLEGRLEEERGEKEEVLAMFSSLEDEREEVLAKFSSLEEAQQSGGEEMLSRAASLQQQVELLAKEKREAWEAVELSEERAQRLEVQAQEQQEARVMLELRITDLEGLQPTAGLDGQMELLLGKVSSLEKEKGYLSKELQDFKELEEFKALEDDCSRDNMRVLHNENGALRSTVESWEGKCRDLESQLGSMSEQLAKKSSWAQELESLQGKDLLQEVSELRRSLDDAEVVGRDTRKEWAVLRSQNLELKERDAELSSSHDQMVVEVGGLRSQLEKEKSRFRSMQTDLQKELTMAFKENTKLTALMDGKVPSHLVENVHLEGTIASLNEELVARRGAESALREELKSTQEAQSALREQLSCSEQQCSSLEGQLRGLQEEKEALMNEALMNKALMNEKEALQEEKVTLQVEKETLQVEKETLKEENEALQVEKETLKEALQVEKETLKEALQVEKEALQVEKETLKEALQVEKEALQVEKEALQVEKETLQVEKETLKEEKETLQVEKETLKEENEALQVEKETLKEEKEALQVEKETLKEENEALQVEKEALQAKMSHSELSRSMEEQTQGSISSPEEVDRRVPAPSQESEQLQGLLEALREEKETLKEEMEGLKGEKEQLQTDLQENVDMMIENQDELRSAHGTIREQKERIRRLESMSTANQNAPEMEALQNHVKALHMELESLRSERDCLSSVGGRQEEERLASEVSALSQEREQLRGLLEALREEKTRLREEMDDKIQMILLQQPGIGQQPSLSDELGSLDQFRMDDLQVTLESVTEEKDRLQREVQLSTEKVTALNEELESVRSERDSQSSVGGRQEMERLASEVSALSQEREQLQALLEALREEKTRDKIHTEQVNLERRADNQTKEDLLAQQIQQLGEIKMQRSDLQEALARMEEEKTGLQEELVRMEEEKRTFLEERAEKRRTFQEEVANTRGEKTGLQEVVDRMEEEKAGLQEKLSQMEEEKTGLQEVVDRMEEEKTGLQEELSQMEEEKTGLQEKLNRIQEEVPRAEEEKAGLQEELSRMEEEKTGLQEELAFVEEEKTGLHEEVARSLEENRTFKEEVSKITKVKTELQEVVNRMEEEKTGLQEVVNRMEEEKTGLQEVVNRMEEEKTGLQEELVRMEEEKTGLQEELVRMEEEKRTFLEERAEKRRTFQEEVANTRGEKTGHQEELSRMEEEKNGLQEKLSQMEEEKTGLQEVVDRMEEEKNGHQEKLSQMEEEKTGLQEELVRMEEEKTGLQEVVNRMEEEKTGLQEELNRIQEEVPRRAEEEKAGLQEMVNRMEEEKTGLQEKLSRMEEEKTGLQEKLSQMEEEKTGLQEKLNRIQEEVPRAEEEKAGLQDELSRMEEEKTGLQEELAFVEEEKTGLQEEVARSLEENRTLKEEVSKITKVKTGLQEVVDRMEEEKTGLQEELNRIQEEEKTGLQEMVNRMEEEKTGLQEELNRIQEEEKTGLQEELNRIQEEVPRRAEEEKAGLQEMVNRMEEEMTGLQEKLSRMEEEEEKNGHQEEVPRRAEEEEKTGLLEMETRRAEEEPTRRLKESAESFQLFISRCCAPSVAPLDQTMFDISEVMDQHHVALPTALLKVYKQIRRNNLQAKHGLGETMGLLMRCARKYRGLMEDLVQSDLEVLEQQRLQDVLLSAPVTPDDQLHAQWERRLPALLDRRELHLQRMSFLLEGLEQSLGAVLRSVAAQLGETGHFLAGLREACSHTPIDLRTLEDLLTAELERSSTAAQLSTNTLQVTLDAQGAVGQELQVLGDEAGDRLDQERSKTAPLLQALDHAPLKPDQLQLLTDNQKLLLQLHSSQNQLTALEEAQLRSGERMSLNKRTTQLLQTELQDACAKIQDKEKAISTLRSKLRQSEEDQARRQTPPSVLELEELRATVLKLEVEVTSATGKHQKEVESLSSRLNIKEESLRKLRETLRKSQQEQHESLLQGEDLYCRLTNPQGAHVQTSGSLERAKLDQEVRLLQLKVTELQLKVTELQSLVSSQQEEISSHQAESSKWKSRAVTLKGKTRAERPRSPAPATPSKKRLLPAAVRFFSSPKRRGEDSPRRGEDSPRRGEDSPRRVLEAPANVPDPNKTTGLDSTEFFGATLSSGASLRLPKQFFDNSKLGINPDIFQLNMDDVSETVEEDASSSAEPREEMWPLSLKEDEMCNTQ